MEAEGERDRQGRTGINQPECVAYLDYNASAPLRPAALEAMLPHLRSGGNAASIHAHGRAASEAVELARRQLAALLTCSASEVVFTSGATEANNLALHLAAVRGNVVVSRAEHPAILEAAEVQSATAGTKRVVIGVNRNGEIDLEALREVLAQGGVGLVSAMAANNETGVLNDLAAIVEVAHQAGALVHTDATQAVGRIPVNLADLDVDLLSLSAHKFGGPQGVGALFVRRTVHLPQRPLLVGGGHERGWRAGTTNVAGVVGMGAAAAVCAARMDSEFAHTAALRDMLESSLLQRVADCWVNGSDARRLSGTASITFAGAPADALMASMPQVAVSDGSACHVGAPEPSHVLLAMGLSRDDAECTLRFSLGYATTQQEIRLAIEATVAAVDQVRAMLGTVTTPRPQTVGPRFTGNPASAEGR